ncbi:hypothetical protein [Aquimarina macrocephali]|uniref:hypothetical protein n=1 Tax=Aquimarina macrocephali TaxID=666563 RepID=UPI003F674D33
MKIPRLALLSVVLLFTFSIYGQTKVDEYISINIPGNVSKLDTIAQGLYILNFHSENETEAYLIQRMKIDSKQSELNNLPSDKKSLKESYKAITRGQIKKMEKAGFHLRDSTEFKIDDFIGYKVSYNDSETGIQNAETNTLILEEFFYVATYINGTNFNKKNKNEYLNSLKINYANGPRQMRGNSQWFKTGYILGKICIYGFLIFGAILLIKKMRKK